MTRYTPPIPLHEFVDYLYVAPEPHASESVNAYREPTHPQIRILVNGSEREHHGHIKGIFTRPRHIPQDHGSRCTLGIRFKPYGLYTGFGISGEFTLNRVVPVSDFFTGKALAMLAACVQVGNEQVAVESIHETLYRRLRPNAILDEITVMIDALIAADLSKNTQRHLALAFERTPKSFIAVFRKAVGTTPLHYLHVHKIEEARRIIHQQPLVGLSDVGDSLGFYDQAHFIRVFKAHAGCTPLQYKKRLNKHAG